MVTAYYPAIIERAENGYGVFFPDLPGCTSAGDTVDEAARNAEDALRGHLALMIADGDDIPEATPLDQIERDLDVDEVARVLVRCDLPGNFVRLNISMDEGVLAGVDASAEQLGMTRSAFLSTAAVRMMGTQAQSQFSKNACLRHSGTFARGLSEPGNHAQAALRPPRSRTAKKK